MIATHILLFDNIMFPPRFTARSNKAHDSTISRENNQCTIHAVNYQESGYRCVFSNEHISYACTHNRKLIQRLLSETQRVGFFDHAVTIS